MTTFSKHFSVSNCSTLTFQLSSLQPTVVSTLQEPLFSQFKIFCISLIFFSLKTSSDMGLLHLHWFSCFSSLTLWTSELQCRQVIFTINLSTSWDRAFIKIYQNLRLKFTNTGFLYSTFNYNFKKCDKFNSFPSGAVFCVNFYFMEINFNLPVTKKLKTEICLSVWLPFTTRWDLIERLNAQEHKWA